MKSIYILGFFSLLFYNAHAQINNGGFHANFGIDADTRSGHTRFGPPAPTPTGDDWFAPFGFGGRAVIDTTGTALYKSLLQQNKNVSFMKQMNAPTFSLVDNRLWLDALYLRDFTTANGKDSTIFGNSAKNGENPNSWEGSVGSIPGKTDLIDCMVHLRRDGSSVDDSLWMFAGVSTYGTNGDRYFDIEIFKKEVSYNRATEKFYSAGISNGHTEWIFDAFGNIIQTGDIIVTFSYKPNQPPVIEVRIWVSRITYLVTNPALFNFANNGYDGGSLYGYAKIVQNNGGTAFGSGIGNYSSSSSASADTTFSTPWGTTLPNNTWSQNYNQLQFVEIGLNLTRMGVDPMLYQDFVLTNEPCEPIAHTIFVKSRSSQSFSANLQDFAGPINLTVPVVGVNYTIKKDTLTCAQETAKIQLLNPTQGTNYSWSTINGEILSSNSDSTIITVGKKGTYQVTASLYVGCSIERTDIVEIEKDDTKPVATADITVTPAGDIQLIGGDVLLSNIITPFGGCEGLEWDWKGPNGFSSTEKDPIVNMDWAWGAYYLTLTEKRNGCKAYGVLDVSFGTLYDLPGSQSRSISSGSTAGKTYISRNASNKLVVNTSTAETIEATVTVHSTSGQLLGKKTVRLMVGQNSIEVPGTSANQLRVVSLYTGNKLSFVRKVVY